jgi:type I restriction enzyme S subunit
MSLVETKTHIDSAIGNISIWEPLRIKDLITKIGSGVTPKGGSEVYVDKGVTFLRSQNVYDDGLRIDDVSFIAGEVNDRMKNSEIKPFDILINITGASIGRTCVVPVSVGKANINQHIIYLRIKKRKVDFLSYYLKSPFIKDYIMSVQAGSSKEALNMGQTLNIPVVIPKPEMQTKIAGYLDKKIEAIDKKVVLLEKKITKYKELRRSLISQIVTKGLNHKVKLKESGIDWIGEVPEHWQLKRLKDVLNLYTGNSISDKSEFEEKSNSIPYIATKNVDFSTGNINFGNGIYIPIKMKGFKVAKPFSTLICLEGANAGKKIGFTDRTICFVNKLCCIKSKNKEMQDKYFYYLSNSTQFKNQFFALINGLIGGVSLSLLKFFDITIPPLDEQIEITNYLDSKINLIDSIINNIEYQIDVLAELRKTLINDVVTGKLKVTEE